MIRMSTTFCLIALHAGFAAFWHSAHQVVAQEIYYSDFESLQPGAVEEQSPWRNTPFSSIPTIASTQQAHSGSVSLETAPNADSATGIGSDIFLDFPSTIDAGKWEISYSFFVSDNFNGTALAQFSETPLSGDPLSADWGGAFVIASEHDDLHLAYSLDGQTAVGVALIQRGEWQHARLTIDLGLGPSEEADNENRAEAFLGSENLFSGLWNNNDTLSTIGSARLFTVGGTTGRVFYDDFRIRPVPEPSGLGSLLTAAFVLVPFGLRQKSRVLRLSNSHLDSAT